MVASKSLASRRLRPNQAKVRSTGGRTMLQSARHVYRAWLRRPTFWRNAENDLDVVLIDFDPAHHAANNLPHAVAIETVESLHDLGGEILRAADDERKIAFETGCVFSGLTPLFE